jgi:hypothetical protein
LSFPHPLKRNSRSIKVVAVFFPPQCGEDCEGHDSTEFRGKATQDSPFGTRVHILATAVIADDHQPHVAQTDSESVTLSVASYGAETPNIHSRP